MHDHHSMKRTLLYLLFSLTSFALFAQEETTPVQTPKAAPLPVISIAQGLINFSGDVGYDQLNQPLKTRSAFQIELQNHTNNSLSFSLFYLNGYITGEEKTYERAVNFQSKFMSGGVMLRYDFLSKK